MSPIFKLAIFVLGGTGALLGATLAQAQKDKKVKANNSPVPVAKPVPSDIKSGLVGDPPANGGEGNAE